MSAERPEEQGRPTTRAQLRPTVSVCMATYNGEAFVREQIESIVRQLAPGDELIVVDDGSKDGTRTVLRDLAARHPSVSLHPNDVNLGVVRSFEKAVTLARGDVIFLADQDDVWIDGKVERTLLEFTRPDVTVVVSNAYLLDDERVWLDTVFDMRPPRHGPRNLVKNTYIGCCLAFSANIKRFILPIPDGAPMHDWWIGLVGHDLGRVVFVDDPLIVWRRHGGTATTVRGKSSAGLLAQAPKMLRERWRMAAVYLRTRAARRHGGT